MDVVRLQVRSRREGGRDLPVLVWRFAVPMRVVASTPHGGGLGPRRWVVNAQVPVSYGRRDPDHHLARMAVSLGLAGRGVGMLTAADVRAFATAEDGGVSVTATVGLGHPVLAAAPDGAGPIDLVGTIKIWCDRVRYFFCLAVKFGEGQRLSGMRYLKRCKVGKLFR